MSGFEDVVRAADQAGADRIAFIRARAADLRAEVADEFGLSGAGLVADADATGRLVEEVARIAGGDWLDAGEEVLAWAVIDLLAERWSWHPDYKPTT